MLGRWFPTFKWVFRKWWGEPFLPKLFLLTGGARLPLVLVAFCMIFCYGNEYPTTRR